MRAWAGVWWGLPGTWALNPDTRLGSGRGSTDCDLCGGGGHAGRIERAALGTLWGVEAGCPRRIDDVGG